MSARGSLAILAPGVAFGRGRHRSDGVPSPLCRGDPGVALVAWAATRTTVSASVIWTIIISNALWVVASIGLLFDDWVDLTALGYGFVIAQAVAVGLFAELQVLGLRNVRTVSA
jgi:hypothetical protein